MQAASVHLALGAAQRLHEDPGAARVKRAHCLDMEWVVEERQQRAKKSRHGPRVGFIIPFAS